MADYTHTFGIKYDVSGRASNLRAQRYDSTGASSGSIVSTGFAELATSGCYSLTITLDDAFRGSLLITDTADATTQMVIELNPEELINADVRTSTRSTLTAAQVRSEMDSASTQLAVLVALVDTVEASLSTLNSKLTPGRATNLDNIGGGTVALSTDVLAIKAKTDNLPAAPAAVGSAMTLVDGAITAIKIAADAITAAKIATDAITEIQNGTATAASLATAQAILDKLNGMLALDGSVYRFTENALELAPAASGGSSAGTGDVRVNETYGASVADPTPLAFVYGGSSDGVDNGWVRAFVKSEYDAGGRTAKGTTRTTSDGAFTEDLLLDADIYYLEYRLADESQATLKEVTVEAA